MEAYLGQVTHYFSHLGVAVITLEGELKLGDTILFLGHTTELTQQVCSLETEHQKLTQAGPGAEVAVKVDDIVRSGDKVFKLLEEGADPQNPVLWKSMRRSLEAIYPTYQGVFADFVHANALSEHALGILLAALSLEPSPIDPERLQVRGPYTAAQTWMARLHAAAAKGFLVEPEPGEFRLSRQGRSKVQKLISQARKAMARADPLEPSDGERLAGLMERLVQACLITPPPPDTWSIRLAYQLMPDITPPLPYIEQALSCLQAYRDDAHLAAWQPSGLNGYTFEALTLLWRGEAASLEELYDKLAFRGFELHDYKHALAELRQRGFIEKNDSGLAVTQTGKEFREQVERGTDHYFFTPWSCLASQEKTEMACLFSDLQAGLKAKETVINQQ